jgi:hypothetical protein
MIRRIDESLTPLDDSIYNNLSKDIKISNNIYNSIAEVSLYDKELVLYNSELFIIKKIILNNGFCVKSFSTDDYIYDLLNNLYTELNSNLKTLSETTISAIPIISEDKL